MHSNGASTPRALTSTSRSKSLLLGLTLLAGVLCANVAAFARDPERSNLTARYGPPQMAWLQRALWSSDSRDTVVAAFGVLRGERVLERNFLTTPLATARTGQPYEYAPSVAGDVAGFSLIGDVPAGLAVDAVSGRIFGWPTETGVYSLILSASRGDGTIAQQRFTLYVDDRFLPLGADGMGRDLLGQLLAAARFTIVPGLIAVLIAVGGGTFLGAHAGYRDTGIARRTLRPLTSLVQTIPALLMVFLVAAVSNYNIYVLMVVVGLVLLPETANGVFERVDAFRKRDFVEAARELGSPDRTILWNEIVWHNLRPLLISRVTQTFVYAILVDVTLTYIGLTVDDAAKLGSILKDGREALLADTTAVPAVASLAALFVVLAGFSLTERGILSAWERTR